MCDKHSYNWLISTMNLQAPEQGSFRGSRGSCTPQGWPHTRPAVRQLPALSHCKREQRHPGSCWVGLRRSSSCESTPRDTDAGMESAPQPAESTFRVRYTLQIPRHRRCTPACPQEKVHRTPRSHGPQWEMRAKEDTSKPKRLHKTTSQIPKHGPTPIPLCRVSGLGAKGSPFTSPPRHRKASRSVAHRNRPTQSPTPRSSDSQPH